MAKNLALFCQCPDNLSEFGLQGNGLIYGAEDISRQESIQAGAEKAAIIVKEISTAEEKPSAFPWDSRKGVLKANSPPSRLHRDLAAEFRSVIHMVLVLGAGKMHG